MYPLRWDLSLIFYNIKGNPHWTIPAGGNCIDKLAFIFSYYVRSEPRHVTRDRRYEPLNLLLFDRNVDDFNKSFRARRIICNINVFFSIMKWFS